MLLEASSFFSLSSNTLDNNIIICSKKWKDLSAFAAGREVQPSLLQIYDIDCYCRSEGMCSVVIVTTTKEASHVYFFLRLFFLLFGLSSSSFSGSSGSTRRSSTSSGSSRDGSEERGNILSSKGLSEKTGPVRLNGVSGSLDDLVELISLDCENITR